LRPTQTYIFGLFAKEIVSRGLFESTKHIRQTAVYTSLLINQQFSITGGFL